MAGTVDEAERRAALNARLVVLGEVASTETALFHQAAAARHGLGITDMKALGALVREGPMTAGQLAKRLSLTTGAVTSVIDRLARRDLVTRVPDARDRRKVIVVANQARLAAGENVYQSIGEAFSALHDTLTTEQLEFLVRYYQASVELTRHEIAKLAGRDGERDDDGDA
ncbi:MAG TPA: MarR family transcriptional regulator [Ktedonobacterales bacterium]|jgi:DNA-binding MarR family transcriptional regulator